MTPTSRRARPRTRSTGSSSASGDRALGTPPCLTKVTATQGCGRLTRSVDRIIRPTIRSVDRIIPRTREAPMGGIASVLYGAVVYSLFFVTFLYAIAFVGNLPVPKTIDSGAEGPLIPALVINTLVLALQAVSWLGWFLVLLSTFLINHFELFGLRQVWARLRGHTLPEPKFRAPFIYKRVRHPIYLGFLLAFWATPVMTAGHLLFAVATTGYILIGIWLEERDLVDLFGDQYRRYREQVSMLIPLPGRKAKPDPEIKHPRPAE